MKKTITCQVEVNGKNYTKKAYLIALSSGSYIIDEKKADNACIDILEDDILDLGYWSVMIELGGQLYVELRFKYNHRTYELTFNHWESYLWNEDNMMDIIPTKVKVTTRQK